MRLIRRWTPPRFGRFDHVSTDRRAPIQVEGWTTTRPAWERWLPRRRPYLEPGTWTGYEIHGRLRLVPAFRGRPLGELSVDDIRGFVAGLAEDVEAGEIAEKTVNNALVTLVVCLNDALQDKLLVANPALRVQRLPPAHIEREYLRLNEIPRYLDGCSDVYRPLADLLIGSGLRISEALALRVSDLELDETGGAPRSSSSANA
jgi:integrase